LAELRGTALSTILEDLEAIKALAGHAVPITSVGELVDYLDADGDLTAIKGIGAKRAEDVRAALDAFLAVADGENGDLE
jgi:hypothetical protein